MVIFRNVSVLAHKVNHNISVILVYTAGENASFRKSKYSKYIHGMTLPYLMYSFPIWHPLTLYYPD